MNEKLMLSQMCHSFLSGADMKEICKTRGFPAEAITSKDLFENLFLSQTGVEKSLASLTFEEGVLLHLMRLKGEDEHLEFFKRLYEKERKGGFHWESYTERYKLIFKQIMSSFVRKGVLLVAIDSGGYRKTKLEMTIFRFPEAFGPHLPPPFKSIEAFDGEGDKRKDVVRDKILELGSSPASSSEAENGKWRMNLIAGQLCIGNEPFSPKLLKQWQNESWVKKAGRVKKEADCRFSPVDAVSYLFSLLKQNEWISPDELQPALKVFFHGSPLPDAPIICEAGKDCGLLKKVVLIGKLSYTMIKNEEEVSLDPATYLTILANQAIAIDLKKIPYDSLQVVSLVSEINLKSGVVEASPVIKKLGRAWETHSKQTLWQWLKDHSEAYRKAMDTVDKRSGKTVIHKNLLIARVLDLSLKIKLEKVIADQRLLVVLQEDFIAFPVDLLPEIERVVKKEGRVIKVVKKP